MTIPPFSKPTAAQFDRRDFLKTVGSGLLVLGVSGAGIARAAQAAGIAPAAPASQEQIAAETGYEEMADPGWSH